MKKAAFSVAFVALLVVIVLVLNPVFRPVWYDWNNYDTIHDFYNEPEDRIEAVFLGASCVVNGISPVQLYEEYGICAYNLGTEQQPLSASYAWLQEAYRLHRNTLKVIVLDISMLFKKPDKWFYQKATEYMSSAGKMQINRTGTRRAEERTVDSLIIESVPLLQYHDRWAELTKDDLSGATASSSCSRGYNCITDQWVYVTDPEGRGYDYDEYNMPFYWYDNQHEEGALDQESLQFFDRIKNFCADHDLRLILMRSPTTLWQDALSKTVNRLADTYDLEFYDFNISPLLNELDFEFMLDLADGTHMNYYGATKFTRWWGEYLHNRQDCADVRGKTDYMYLEEQSRKYQDSVMRSIQLNAIDNVAEYIQSARGMQHCAVLLCVKDDAAGALTDKTREDFSAMGLQKLANQAFRDSYIGAIVDGQTVLEKNGKEAETEAVLSSAVLLSGGEEIILKSTGVDHGDAVASVMINGYEYARNQRGINIVVYDYLNDSVLDSAVFDTFVSVDRKTNLEQEYKAMLGQGRHAADAEGVLRTVYLYNRRCENLKHTSWWEIYGEDMALFSWLMPWISNDRYSVLISARDEASYSLTEESLEKFEELGLHELSQIEYRDSYIGVIDDGEVIYEKRDHGDSPIRYNGLDVKIISGGFDSGDKSSVIINGKDYSLNRRGLNLVVYDKELHQVISQASFDTYEAPILTDALAEDDVG